MFFKITWHKLAISFILMAITLFIYSFSEPYWIKMNRITVFDEDIPVSFDGKTVVFLSDIHHGPFFSSGRLQKVVNKVNKLGPDIIILGGDYVHRSPKYIEPCFEGLKNLEASLGKFGVLGNHDHWEGAELTWANMQKAGITPVDNRAQWVYANKERIKVGGVGDLLEDTQDISPTIRDVFKNDFVVLVSHNPDYAEKIVTDKVDLVLSGHTHGGQVTLFGLWAPLIPSTYGQKYRTGWVQSPQTKVYVSNGVGNVTPPVRFFARPGVYPELCVKSKSI